MIFKNTEWSDDPTDSYKGFGFVIKKVGVIARTWASGQVKSCH